MIKPKHYGLVTSLGAVVVTVLPACVFVLIGRSPLLDERRADKKPSAALQEIIDSVGDAPTIDERVAHVPTPVVTEPAPTPFVPLPFSGGTYSAPITKTKRGSKRGSDTVLSDAETVSDTLITSGTSDSAAGRSVFGGHSGWPTGGMDLSERLASSDVKAVKPGPVDPVPTPVEPPPPSERLFPPVYEPMSSSVGEATGHQLSASSKADAASMASDSMGTSSSMDRLKKRVSPEPSAALLAAAMEPPKEEVPFVEMILKSPVESRRARRVENVLAFTNETGWPIAMVRSDLPDSRWWVQQMTAIRGNAFSARVNFGNETSLPGSKYNLVFVFLESQDEVRRFNIAKQFKEIPAGVRRSREYTFVRK